MISLRRLGVDDWRLWRELRLEALREAPYAFGSTLAEWQGTGDLESRWRDRLANVPLNVIASIDGIPAGMAGGTHPDERGTVELISMWVAPVARGRSVGDALVEAVIQWAVHQRASSVVLSVREGNLNAIALYARHGFTDVGRAEGDPDGSARERLMSRRLHPF